MEMNESLIGFSGTKNSSHWKKKLQWIHQTILYLDFLQNVNEIKLTDKDTYGNNLLFLIPT